MKRTTVYFGLISFLSLLIILAIANINSAGATILPGESLSKLDRAAVTMGNDRLASVSNSAINKVTGGSPTTTPTILLPTSTVTPGAPTTTPTPGLPTTTPTPGLPTATPTLCTIQFSDVAPSDTFYPYIHCLACRGIIGGYPDGTFRPGNNVTRGQMAKIVSNAAGFVEPVGTQQFQDVAPGSSFYEFITRLADRSIVSGYPCGGPGEPCEPGNLPYFRPNSDVTRGQLSKIIAQAANLSQPAGNQQYADVMPASTFYNYIWRLTNLGVMSGYLCGGVGEPCIGPTNDPYFRPSSSATRGQASKIVSNTFFPECQPSATPTPTATPTILPTIHVYITAQGFNPQHAHGVFGDTVVWTNQDSVARSVIADDNSFSSGPINPGATWSWSPSMAVSYHSGEHPEQTGTITLEDPYHPQK